MINKYEVEEIIKTTIEELDGILFKHTHKDKDQKEPIQTIYEAKVEEDENGDLIFSLKGDCLSEQTDKYRIKIEMI